MPTAAETKRNKNAEAMLRDAIASANPKRVRDVLSTICNHLPQARDLACAELLVNAADESEEQMTSNKKRPSGSEYTRQRYEICEQCEEEFDVVENDEDEGCEWHDGMYMCITYPFCVTSNIDSGLKKGELEADDEADIWADHEERTHGPIDTEQNRKDHPEGFIWSCCDEFLGATEGCQTGPHVAQKVKKRKRV
jgi:hypothetical protein